MSLYIFIEVKKIGMIPSEKIQLFSIFKQNQKSNPEQAATRLLLQISDEDYSYDPLNVTDNSEQSPKLQRNRGSFSERNSKSLRRQSCSKVQIPNYLAKTHNNFHKESARYLSGQEVCVMKKEKVVNLSNFLLIDKDNSAEIITSIPKQQFQEDIRGSARSKPPKNIVAFIRKRNLSYLKQQFNFQLQEKKIQSIEKKINNPNFLPLRRINASCQLRKVEQQFNQQKYVHIFDRSSNASPEMNSTSPNFRNRKMSNYMKYRICLGKAQKNLYF